MIQTRQKPPVLLMVDDDREDIYLTKRAFCSLNDQLVFKSVQDGEALFHYLNVSGDYVNNTIDDAGTSSPPPGPPPAFEAQPDVFPCLGGEICYSIPDIRGAKYYRWFIPDFASVVDGGDSTNTFVCLRYDSLGGGVLMVQPFNECLVGFPVFKPIIVEPAVGSEEESTFVCNADFPLEDSIRILTSQAGCDSIIKLDIHYVDTLPAPEVICQIDSSTLNFSWNHNSINDGYLIEIQGVIVDTTQNEFYSYTQMAGDSLIHFRVIPFGNASCPYEIGEVTCDLQTSSTSTLFHESGLKIYPNPTNGQVQIESESEIEWVNVFDISGRKVLTSKEQIIDLSYLNSGIYIFKIKTRNESITKKIFKL